MPSRHHRRYHCHRPALSPWWLALIAVLFVVSWVVQQFPH
jgi:hypothetical protein